MTKGAAAAPFLFPARPRIMKNGFLLFLLTCLLASMALPQSSAVKPAKKASGKTAPTKTAPHKTAPHKTAAKPAAKTARAGSSKKGKSSAKSTRASTRFQPRQLAPTPDRYREIQQALADKGYLKSEPDGVWDAQSMDALRRFQTDRNLSATGKISSASLIGLGLGPSTAPVPPPPASPAAR